MSKTIWKSEIPPTGAFAIKVQKGSEILGVPIQVAQPCIWFMFETELDVGMYQRTQTLLGEAMFAHVCDNSRQITAESLDAAKEHWKPYCDMFLKYAGVGQFNEEAFKNSMTLISYIDEIIRKKTEKPQ